MSRNLCTSSCCGNTVRLSDLRGKPIEFRQYSNEPPHIGTRWDCPTCLTAYFVIWRDGLGDSSSRGYSRRFVLDLSYYESYNDEHTYDDVRMASEVGMTPHKTVTPSGVVVYKNYLEILETWQKQNPDKPMPVSQDAAYLCLDNAEDTQDVW